ncbi:class I SAM-dependent methyltransferase [Nocardioides alcanivorans]|uniref:class I SAM-dependent methyltransferase n=1 Tax=Nocardioides alcanivorans TaxID=2897352 RepID=UPI001F2333BF|nr:SAM-dependent methyltransferase [Nocardioides alcanivorans]
MAAEPVLRVLSRMRSLILDDTVLVRAVGSGRIRGQQTKWRRVELRWVDLKGGRSLQVTAYDDTQAFTSNHPIGDEARDAVDDLLDEPFANWHVETTTEQHQVKVTRKQEAFLHTAAREEQVEPTREHDMAKQRLLPEDDPVLVALGISDKDGRIKPTRQAKYRQVEEFLRLLDTGITDAIKSGHLRKPTAGDPLRVVDLGCGNAYLTFAAHRFLSHVRELPVHLTGVDVKEQSARHNSDVAAGLGISEQTDFVVGGIGDVVLERTPEVVLALHACDTATDDALARAVDWEASLVLAAPCCHHDIAAQMRRTPTPSPYAMVTRHGILRERFADTLTDALRAALLRLHGYRVDVVEFVESQHTPRNTMLRSVRTGKKVTGGGARKEYSELVEAWAIRPHLAVLLDEV